MRSYDSKHQKSTSYDQPPSASKLAPHIFPYCRVISSFAIQPEEATAASESKPSGDIPYESISSQTVPPPQLPSNPGSDHQQQQQQQRVGTQLKIETQKWFQPLEIRGGKMSSRDLQTAFEMFQGKRFSDSVCKFIVRIFDLDKNGGLDLQQFEYLYHHVKMWLSAFNAYDRDKDGLLDEADFTYALQKLGIELSPEFVHYLLVKSNPGCKKISQDVFIIMCVRLQKFTDEFKLRDPQLTGRINLKYEEFLELIMKCVNQ